MTRDDEPRYRAVHAYLSDEAHETWQEVATQYGVSVSALIEAIGADLRALPEDQVIGVRLPDLIARSRRIDAQRRRRSHRKATPPVA